MRLLAHLHRRLRGGPLLLLLWFSDSRLPTHLLVPRLFLRCMRRLQPASESQWKLAPYQDKILSKNCTPWVEPREVPPTAEIARFGRYTACWRESELSQPRPFPVPPLPQFGSPVRGQSRALMRVLNCLDCTAGYPVHHEGAAHGVADCDSAAMLARSSLCQFTVSFRLRSLRRGDKCA